MGSPQLAASLGSQVTHTGAMPGLLTGAAGGALLLGAALLTGGAAVILLGIAAAAGTALGGEYIGAAITSPVGIISTGSANVFIAGLPAARAVVDVSSGCAMPPSPHPPVPIATGAATVFINGIPAARHGDQLPCGGAIQAAHTHVFIGGATVALIPVRAEVPASVNRFLHTMMVVSLVGGVVILTMGTGLAAIGAGVGVGDAVLAGLGVGVRLTAGLVLANRVGRDAGIIARHEGATELQARVSEQVAAILAAHAMEPSRGFPNEMGAQPRPDGHPFPGWRLPRNGGAWDGPEGNSNWYPGATEDANFRAVRDGDGTVIQDPNNPVVQAVGPGGIPFSEGQIDLSAFSDGRDVTIDVSGNDSADFRAADAAFAHQLGGEWTADDVFQRRTDEGLTWHHAVDGKTMQLVPSPVNNGVPHTGGASLVRNNRL